MRVRFSFAFLTASIVLGLVSSLSAQDLGPQFKKIKDGIYVEATPQPSDKYPTSNCSIILTQDGVILINSGTTPLDSRLVQAAIKKLTPLPVRFIIDTETHFDHTTGHFVFSPPAVVIAREGTGEAMLKADDPQRVPKLLAQSPEMREAAQGDRLITPQIEYHDKMTLKLGERTLELIAVNNVHSEADTAVWLPSERVLFAAAAVTPNALQNIRPFINASDMVAGLRLMKSLNPEIVVPAHGAPGTAKMFDDALGFYALLLERVDKMVKEGRSLDQIKQELRMPEYDSWVAKERLQDNIAAAYRTVKGS
jgi:cyclase